jgi:putative FmdB family regulatory protein
VPLYEYRCRACGHRFEILQRLGEGADGLACPRCTAAELVKEFSTFSSAGGDRSASDAAPGCAAPGCGAGFG